MGNTKVGMDGLQKAVKQALEETRELTGEALKRAVDKTSRETVNQVKGAAPVRTGKYAKGWTSKNTDQGGRGTCGRTVYQRAKPGLAHLLQHGHGGPRPAGAHPHIPSDEETAELLERNLESEMAKR
ncbi:MAG: HK97 gp10 family phage protein [Lachnospiraceae bacterium]|jgi:hypothetical protein|nr:HK97 gp10 family phage protein [Lachnospiraceae bacterium]